MDEIPTTYPQEIHAGPNLDEGVGERLPAGDYYAVPVTMTDQHEQEPTDGQKRNKAKVVRGVELVIQWFKP